MARNLTTLVDIGALIVSGRFETRSALTDRFPIFHLAQAIEAVQTFAWVKALESFLVTGMIESAVIVLTAINAEAA